MGIRRSAATLAVAVALMAGSTGAAQAVAGAGPAWGACADPTTPAGIECTTLDVPVDWNAPDGRKITLDLAMARATSPDRAGAVLMNPGGPGISGIGFLKRKLATLDGLRTRMDVVTWNPRGSDGRYLPYDVCVGGPTLISIKDRAGYDAAAAAGAAAMAPCRAADPQLFDHMDSASQARDMDAIRAAIGEPELNYLGNSYGGVLGASYARLFPDRVRTMFLDSIIDHVSDPREMVLDQYRTWEEMFSRFQVWCTTAADCSLRGQDVGQVWRGLVAAADRTPVPVVGSNPPLALDGDALKGGATGSVLHPDSWPALSAGIASAVAGDAAQLDLSGQGIQVVLPALALATQCADGLRFDGFDDYAASRRDSEAVSPNFTGERENYVATCAGWPAPVVNPTAPLPGLQLPPFLGAAPIPEHLGVQAVIDQVPGSVTIRFDDAGHGLYLNEGNLCVVALADRYLIDGALPPAGTVCPPDQP